MSTSSTRPSTDQPFTIRPHAGGLLCYEGPFGPLCSRCAPERACAWLPGIEITGEGVELATFEWGDSPVSGLEEPSWQRELEHGITASIDGVTLRFHRPRSGLTRASRTVQVERPGGARRFRIRRLNTFSLETADGVPLVQEQGLGPSGVVFAQADLIDVVTMLLLDQSAMCDTARATSV